MKNIRWCVQKHQGMPFQNIEIDEIQVVLRNVKGHEGYNKTNQHETKIEQ